MSKRFFKKIIARSEQDLRVISALCEKSKARIDQIKFLKENKIFILMLERKLNEENNSKNIQSIIKCEYVNNVKSKKIIQTHKEKVLDLFAIDSHKFDKKYMISFYYQTTISNDLNCRFFSYLKNLLYLFLNFCLRDIYL